MDSRSSKVCFKCGEDKVLSEFYSHPKTSDGLLGKCKSCTKKDTKKQTEKNTSTPEGLEKERARHRDKFHRLGYNKRQQELRYNKTWVKLYKYTNLRKKYYPDLSKDFELHHWNYTDDYLEDIFVINIKDHRRLHNYLNLDIEKRIFYLDDGSYLDTKEKHKNFIESLGIKIN